MTFMESVRTVLSKYATFSGRARRSEYWWFVLFTVIVGTVARLIDTMFGYRYSGPVSIILGLALLLPGLAVAVRRLHDIGRSGWWILLGLIPLVGTIILIVWYVQDGSPGDNAYGSSPKAGAVADPGLAQA